MIREWIPYTVLGRYNSAASDKEVKVLTKFVWSRLVHAPYPDALVFVGSYNRDCLLNPETREPSHSDTDSVELMICIPFNVIFLSRLFSYQGKDISTPYLSCLSLEDKMNDCKLLGNASYSPGLSNFSPWSFRHFFTGAGDLGFYLFDTSRFGHNFPYILEEHYFPRYVRVAYYVLDLLSQKRISGFFGEYEKAEDFARAEDFVRRLFCDNQGQTNSICCVSACVREISHPIGFFAYVKTETGIIYASELFSFFRELLLHGGETID